MPVSTFGKTTAAAPIRALTDCLVALRTRTVTDVYWDPSIALGRRTINWMHYQRHVAHTAGAAEAVTAA